MFGRMLVTCAVALAVLLLTDPGLALDPDTTAFDRATANTERYEGKEMRGAPESPPCEPGDAPDPGEVCASIESMELSCDVDRGRLRARVDSALPPCTELRLVADGSFYQDTPVRWVGRAWTWWRNPMPGEHHVCVDGCDICVTVTCGCASDEDCDDGLYCNGQETCDADTGECVAGSAPCTGCDTCDEDSDVCAGPPDDGSYVYRTGGGLNNQPVDADQSEISVVAGAPITGSILVETYNSMGPGSVAPLGWTVDWGLREDQPRLTDSWIPTGTSNHQIDIDVIAPEEPGDYHIVVAFAGRYTIDQVMSETKQDVPENPVWHDGNDVGFDWTEAQFETAVNDGVACSSVLYAYPDGYGHHWLPATVVTVHVVTGCQDDGDCNDGETCREGECVPDPCSNGNLIQTTDLLSLPRAGLAATTLGDRAFFAGGYAGGGASGPVFDLVDIYNATTDTWSTDNLSFARKDLAAVSVCGKAIFAGGFFYDGSWDNGRTNRVDIYDSATDSWSTATLSIGRENIGATVVGDKALFAGGHGENYLRTSRVDLYDCSTDTWLTAELSQGRELPGATTVGSKAIFAGGRPDHYAVTDRVDVYDFDTDTWSVDAPLSLARMGIAATTVCNKAIFAGGYYRSGSTWVSTDRVDIYDLDTDQWTTATLSQPQGFAQATAVGSKAIFAGGLSGWSAFVSSDVVDVYDCETDTWSTAPPLSHAVSSHAATTIAGRAMFAGGGNPVGYFDTIDIYSLDCDIALSDKIVLSARMTAGDQADIFSMNPDGTALTNLTADLDADAGSPAVSPDGRHIAFSAGSPYSWDIWVMNSDGSAKTIVQSGLVFVPQWYDDATLFYTRTLTTSCPFSVEIRSIEFDGTQWTNDALVVANAISIGKNTTETFAISPDRSRLVWDAQAGCWSPTCDIYVCDLNGTVCTNPRPFYADAGNDQMDTNPVWSHDGQSIYWRHDAAPGVETDKAIVMKAIDSLLPVTDYDAVVRPAGVDGNQLAGPFDIAPDDSRILFFSNASHGLYTWDLGIDNPIETLVLSADSVGGASWGLLD